MSVDALALLRIEKLAAPRTQFGIEIPVKHYHDASVISTFTNFYSLTPDEFSLAVRKEFGAALDAHDDARGILFFPDVCEFRGKTYDAIVREVEKAGFWTPKVDAEHVPIRYTNAAPGTHDELVGRMIAVMGRDDAVALDLGAQVRHAMPSENRSPELAAAAKADIEKIAGSMGSEFAARYEKSVATKLRDDRAALDARFDSMRELHERAQQGKPLVSVEELDAFVASGGADAVFANLDPSLREALEKQLSEVDPDALGDNDLAKVLLTALRRPKT